MEILLKLYSWEELLLCGVALVCFIILLYYHLICFRRVITHRHSKRDAKEEGISIVVVVKDEQDFIKETIPVLLSQEYEHGYEVIVVNDSPERDETRLLLERMSIQHSNLYVTYIRRDISFKHTSKLAITIGIKAARYNSLIVMDAKSRPSSKEWLRYMSYGFTSEKVIVCGYNTVAYGKGLLNRYARVANICSSLLSLSKAVKGKPYMIPSGNGGYTRSVFFDNKGFCDYLRLNSGENDLFVQRVLRNGNNPVSVILNPKAKSEFVVEKGGGDLWRKRRRFANYTFRYYPKSIKAFVLLDQISKFVFWGVIAAMLILNVRSLWYVALAFVLLRWIVLSVTLYRFTGRTDERRPFFMFLLYDITSPIDFVFLNIRTRVRPSQDLWLGV